MEWQISNATLINAGEDIKRTSGFSIHGNTIQTISGLKEGEAIPAPPPKDILNINLHGLFVFPGLTNAHDNLLATYHIFHGANKPYTNWLAWDNELKSSVLFRERMLLEPADLYQLGSYRNILSGVTNVSDHIPHNIHRPFQKNSLVRLLSDFGLSHSLSSYALQWGRGIVNEYKYACENNLPYILHIAEGFDEESRESLTRLEELGALGPNTVLVHGLALSPTDLDKIAKAGSHIVWCPVSNMHIYEKTTPIREALERSINVCLGSDAAMYGSQNLLQDMRFAKEYYQKKYNTELDEGILLKMATVNACDALRLKQCGRLQAGSQADFFVLRGKYAQDPLRSLYEAELSEISLVVCDGLAIYGTEAFEPLFTSQGSLLERFKLSGQKRIIRKLDGHVNLSTLMQKVANNIFDFFPVSSN